MPPKKRVTKKAAKKATRKRPAKKAAKKAAKKTPKKRAPKRKKDGLSDFEHEMAADALGVDGKTEEVAYAKNIVKASEALGITRRTFQRWREEKDFPEPASDGRWPILEIKKWALENGKKVSSDKQQKDALEVRRLQIICDKLEFEFEVVKGEYLHKEEVGTQIIRAINETRKVLLGLPTSLAPDVIGLDVADAEELIRKGIFGALNHLSENAWTG